METLEERLQIAISGLRNAQSALGSRTNPCPNNHCQGCEADADMAAMELLHTLRLLGVQTIAEEMRLPDGSL